MAQSYPETEKSERMTNTRTTVVTVIGLAVILVFSGQFLFAHSSRPLPKPETIKEVANEQDFKTILDNAGQKLIVFDLYASWCAPCRVLHPTLEALAVKYAGKVDFYRLFRHWPSVRTAFAKACLDDSNRIQKHIVK